MDGRTQSYRGFFLWAACVVLNIIISFFLFLYKRKCSCIYLENGMQKLLKLLISSTYQDMDTDLEYRNAVCIYDCLQELSCFKIYDGYFVG